MLPAPTLPAGYGDTVLNRIKNFSYFQRKEPYDQEESINFSNRSLSWPKYTPLESVGSI
jgi:hypothetical protein